MSSHANFSSSITSMPSRIIPTQVQTFTMNLKPYLPFLETMLMLGLYSPFIRATYLYLPNFPHNRKAKAVGFPPKTLGIHVFASAAIMIKYYSTLSVSQTPITSNGLDLVLYTAQILTAFQLTKTTKNHSSLYKASFQVMTSLVAFSIIAAFLAHTTEWHRTAVKCVEWFVWFRWGFLGLRQYKLFEAAKTPHDVLVHLISVPFTLAMANWNSAICVYLVALPLMMKANAWVTRQVPNRCVSLRFSDVEDTNANPLPQSESARPFLQNILISLSICDRATLLPPVQEESLKDK